LGGCYFRSSWEANWARYLNFRMRKGEVLGWEFEADTFDFPVLLNDGAAFYTPDFKVRMPDGAVEYHEVKGQMSPEGKLKLSRMREFYPQITVRLVDREVYRRVGRRFAGRLPHWERKAKDVC